MWELDHKAEHWKIDTFELWCWRRLLRVPWTVRRSNQSILKEINPEYSLEGLILQFQYFGHLMQRADSLEKTLMLGKIEGRRRRGWQRTRWLDGITDSMDMSFSKLQEMVRNREAWHGALYGVAKSRIWLSTWQTTPLAELFNCKIRLGDLSRWSFGSFENERSRIFTEVLKCFSSVSKICKGCPEKSTPKVLLLAAPKQN